MSSFIRSFLRKGLMLKKSQLSLFDWSEQQPKHQEVRTRQAYTRTTKTGAVTQVAATQAKVTVKDHPALPAGTKVHYKTPEMPRKKKGTIISGDHKRGYMIKPVREGYNLNPAPIYSPREHLWTQEEHENKPHPQRSNAPEDSLQRQETAANKTGMKEAEVLQHPKFVQDMHRALKYLAGSNGHNPNYQNVNGVLLNDDPASNELYSEYITAAMGAYRSAASKATPEDVEEFNRYLSGISKDSHIAASMHRSGKTAALRHITKHHQHNMSHQSYDSAMEDDMESGMRQVSTEASEGRSAQQSGNDKAAIEAGVMEQIKLLDDPVAEYILTAKFGLGDLTHGYKEQDIASALNKRNIPSGDDEPWTSDKVKVRMKDALARLARTRGVQDLRVFMKSLRDLEEMRKSLPAPLEIKLQKIEQMLEQAYLVKSHIKEYTRADGTVVQAHDDRRQKHDHIAGHELSHGEKVHTGATLKHGKELMDHLQSKGWKHKEVSAVRSNGKEAGNKKEMPKPPEIKGANKENSALKSAQNVITKMHENAGKHSDPASYLKHITTSRSNPYLKAVDDYRTALLNHFGYDVDHDIKDQRFEKDGHVVTLSDKDGEHTVEHAGYEEKEQKDTGVNPTKDTLAQAIAKIGGMNAEQAKRQFDLTGKDFPAIKGALKKDGLDPDKVAEILSQHGYIKTDANGKHDYDDFQDKLRRAATGEKVYSMQRDQQDQEDELAQQEKEFIESRGIDDPSSEVVGFNDLHEEMQKEYKSVFEEALAVLGKDATNKLIAMHQDDVPFGVKEYVDAQLRRAIDESQGHGKQGDDSKAGKQGTTRGSGQAASERSTDDTGKGAGAKSEPAGAKPADKPAGERSGSGTNADAVTFSKLKSAVEKFDPSYRYTDSIKSPDVKSGSAAENDIIRMAKQLYKMDPQRTMSMLGTTGIFEHQIAPQKVNTPKSQSISSLEAILRETKPKELRKSVNHIAYIRRTKTGGTASIAEKGSPRDRHLSANHEEAQQYVARMWRHGAEESDIIAGLHKQYGIKAAYAAEILAEHKRNKET